MSIFSPIPGGSAGNEVKSAFDAANQAATEQIVTTLGGTNTILEQRVSFLQGQIRQLNAELEVLRRNNRNLTSSSSDASDELRNVRTSLKDWVASHKELEEVLGGWRDSYEQQRQILKDWMVSQRGFKELALKYGIESLGKTRDEVIEDFKAEKQRVLDNTTVYGNNLDELKY